MLLPTLVAVGLCKRHDKANISRYIRVGDMPLQHGSIVEQEKHAAEVMDVLSLERQMHAEPIQMYCGRAIHLYRPPLPFLAHLFYNCAMNT
jgi:hypothetical protein